MFTKVRGALEGAENIKEGAEKIKGGGASAPPSPILPTLMYPEEVKTFMSEGTPEPHFQERCAKLCENFRHLFKLELGSLKDFELEIEYKDSAKPKFCKPRQLHLLYNLI